MAVTMPSGFRFVPTDMDLVREYLLKKITNQPLPSDAVVIEYDVYNTEPWNLPVNKVGSCARFYRRCIRERNYYFVPREKNDDKSLWDGNKVKYMVKCGDGTSNRIVGYWKRTRLSPRAKFIRDERKKIVGIMKAFVFHYYTTKNDNNDNNYKNDNECSDIETMWVMHEYTLNSQRFQPWVMCSVISKSIFNIGSNYLNKYKVIDDPPIDSVVAEGNAAFATRDDRPIEPDVVEGNDVAEGNAAFATRDDSPIEPDVVEGNEAFATRPFLALIESAFATRDDPPIEPDGVEGNAAFATRPFLALIERSKGT